MKRFDIVRHIIRRTDILSADGVHPLLPSGEAGRKAKILIVDSDVSFFKLIELPPDAKVNRAFVEMNYIHLAPFDDVDFCYVQVKQKLLLWFYPACGEKYLLVIPEGYLVWKGAGKTRRDAICTRLASGRVKFFVLREGILKAEFVKVLFGGGEEELDEAVQFLREDSELEGIERVALDDSFLQQGLKSINIRDLLPFIRMELDRETLLAQALDAVKWPLVLLLSVYMATSYGMYFTVTREIKEVREQVSLLQTSNQAFKKRLEEHASLRQVWETFIASEYAYPPSREIVEDVARIIDEDKGSINQVKLTDNRMTVAVFSTSISACLEKLQKIDYFEKVTLNGAVNKDEKSGKERAIIEATLRKKTRDRRANP